MDLPSSPTPRQHSVPNNSAPLPLDSRPPIKPELPTPSTPRQPSEDKSVYSVVSLCQQFLLSRGLNTAAEALTQLKSQDPQSLSSQILNSQNQNSQSQNSQVSQVGSTALSDVSPTYSQFHAFWTWVRCGLDELKAEFTEIAWILFVDSWIILMRQSYDPARSFLLEFETYFNSGHQQALQQMKCITDFSQICLNITLKWWTETHRFTIVISRLGYRLLMEYLLHLTPNRSLLHSVQARVQFQVTSAPLVEDGEKLPQVVVGASNPGVQEEAVGIAPIPWGLLSGPFSSVQQINDNPIPNYLSSDQSLALINGEITSPVNPNLALPLADESPWAVSRWAELFIARSKSAILGNSVNTFPSVLSYALENISPGLSAAAINPSNGRWVLLGRESGEAEIWDVPALSVVGSKNVNEEDHTEDEEFGGISIDESHVEFRTQAPPPSTPRLLLGHSSFLSSFAFVPPGVPDADLAASCESHALSSSSDGKIRLWDLSKAQGLAVYEAHEGGAWSVDSSPYGNFFLSGGADRLVSLWCYGRTQPLRIMTGHTSDVEVVKCWPNSVLAATGSPDSTVKVWDIRTPQQVRDLRLHSSSISQIALSPNGRLLASAGDILIVWDVATAKPMISLPLSFSVTSIAFARGSRFLAVGCSDGSLLFVDVERCPADANERQMDAESLQPVGEYHRVIPLGGKVPFAMTFLPTNVLLTCATEVN